MKAMAPQRSHSIEFKRQVAQEFIAGESLYALSNRHDISRQLIRVWVQEYEAGALDEDAQAADLLQEYEAKIVALERMVGRQALEIEFLKGALKNAPRPRSVNTSVIAGPAASPSQNGHAAAPPSSVMNSPLRCAHSKPKDHESITGQGRASQTRSATGPLNTVNSACVGGNHVYN
jgi:transposase